MEDAYREVFERLRYNWEANHVLMVDFDGSYGIENLGGWAVGYCALVKIV